MVSFIIFMAWIGLAACGFVGWWLLLTPIMVFSLWRDRAFEPRTQAWLDEVARRAYSKIFKM